MEEIIALWEEKEYAEETSYSNIFFHKAYDRLYWNSILVSLLHMGFGFDFICMISTLFEKTFSKVLVHGDMIEAIPPKRSIRQDFPLVPQLYDLALDGLNWLVVDRIGKGLMQGMPTGECICMESYAHD